MTHIPLIAARYTFSLRDHYDGCLPLLRQLLERRLPEISHINAVQWSRHGLYGHTRHESRRFRRIYEPLNDADDTLLIQLYIALIIHYITRDCYTGSGPAMESIWTDLVARDAEFRNAIIPFENMALSPLYWICSSHLSDQLQSVALDHHLVFRMSFLVEPPPLPLF